MARGDVYEAVKNIVFTNALYGLILASGLANLSALARAVKPLVDAALGVDVKINTIVKSLERARSSARSPEDVIRALSEMEVVAHMGVAEVDVSSPEAVARVFNSAVPFVVVGGSGRARVLGSSMALGVRSARELGIIKITLPRKAPVGAVTFLVQVLKVKGVTVEHMLRYDNEIYIVVDRGAVATVLSTLEELRRLGSASGPA